MNLLAILGAFAGAFITWKIFKFINESLIDLRKRNYMQYPVFSYEDINSAHKEAEKAYKAWEQDKNEKSRKISDDAWEEYRKMIETNVAILNGESISKAVEKF